MNRMCACIMVGGLAFLWLPLGAAASYCQVETCFSAWNGVGAPSGADCTEQEREARAVDAVRCCRRSGKEGDRSLRVVIRGDLSLDMLPVARCRPSLGE